MAWIALLVAGLLEIVWALSMKQSEGFTRLVPSVVTLVALAGSMGLLAYAMRALPLGTAYPIWVGIGAIGAFALGVIMLGEVVSLPRIGAVILIVTGVVLLKLSPQA